MGSGFLKGKSWLEWLKVAGFFLVILSLFTGLTCKRKPPTSGDNTPPPQEYDPRNISRNDTYSVGPSITVGPDGTVYVAWMDGGHGEYEPSQIYFRYKPPGGEWSEIEILTDTTEDSWAPHLSADPFGNVHLVWEADQPGSGPLHSEIHYRMRTPSGEWSDVTVLSNTWTALQPRIAVDPSGTVHVIWEDDVGLKGRYKQKVPGGTWGETEELPTDILNPSIAVDHEGGVYVVYEGGDEDIYYLYRSPTGEWSEPVNVSQSPQWYSWAPTVTVSKDGEVWVNWVERGQRAMYYSVKTLQGEWTIPDSVPNIPGFPGTNKILFDSLGNIHFVWQEIREGSRNDIYHKVYTRQGNWEPDVNVSTTDDESVAPDFAVGAGGIHVVWGERFFTEDYQENYEIYYVFIPY